MPAQTSQHIPVMLDDAIAALNVQRDRIYIDATAGAGGHLQKICSIKGTGDGVVAFDRDLNALEKLRIRFFNEKQFSQVCFIHTNFANISTALANIDITTITGGILADLGISSDQLAAEDRGFSFLRSAPLDMRMDISNSSVTAHQLVNELKEKELADLIYKYGEERDSRRIAAKIVHNRPIKTTVELANLVASCKRRAGKKSIHPATKTFQALRMAVNNELENLHEFLIQSVSLLAPGGRLVVITFHSLEDRMVKQFFKQMASSCLCPPKQPICTCNNKAQLRILTRKPIVPSRMEVQMNLRSRSAKLRAAEKLAQ